jgi:hypothetical protein
MCLSALPGILQNDTAPMMVDNRPLFDLLDRAKAAQTDIIIVQAAISYARGLGAVVDITHVRRTQSARPANLSTPAKRNPRNPSQGQRSWSRAVFRSSNQRLSAVVVRSAGADAYSDHQIHVSTIHGRQQ